MVTYTLPDVIVALVYGYILIELEAKLKSSLFVVSYFPSTKFILLPLYALNYTSPVPKVNDL